MFQVRFGIHSGGEGKIGGTSADAASALPHVASKENSGMCRTSM